MANYKLNFTGDEINTRLEAVPGLEERIGNLESQNGSGSGANGQTETLVVPVDTTRITINRNQVTLNNAIIQDGKKFSVIEFVPKATYSISQIVIENSPNITLKLNGAILQAKETLRGFILENGSYVTGGETAFIKVDRSHFFTIENGIINGASMVSKGMEIKYSTKATIKNIELYNIGNKMTTSGEGIAGATGIFFLGTCDNFLIQQCYIHDIYSRISKYYINNNYDEWDERRIHTYGIFVDEFKETETDENNVIIVTRKDFSANGVITNTILEKINRTDSDDEEDQGQTPDTPGTELAELEYEGEGIFIQQLPWWKRSTIIIPESNIRIENCVFNYCKKRGIKCTSRNVHVKNCIFKGPYYFAPIEFQYGYSSVENCKIENKHNPNMGGICCGICINEGGVIIRDTEINCYREFDDGVGGRDWMGTPDSPIGEDEQKVRSKFANGLVFNGRNNRSPYLTSEDKIKTPWDKCIFERVNFINVNSPITIVGSADKILNTDNEVPSFIHGIDIIDCYFYNFQDGYCVKCDKGIFDKIDSLRFIEFKIGRRFQNQKINYPINIPRQYYKVENGAITDTGTSLSITGRLEIYSSKYNNLPCMIHGSYDATDHILSNLPLPQNTLIIYRRDFNSSDYRTLHKKYTYFNTQFVANCTPDQLKGSNYKSDLKNARVGDEYICEKEDGTRIKYICTSPGSEIPTSENEDVLGTWEQVAP